MKCNNPSPFFPFPITQQNIVSKTNLIQFTGGSGFFHVWNINKEEVKRSRQSITKNSFKTWNTSHVCYLHFKISIISTQWQDVLLYFFNQLFCQYESCFEVINLKSKDLQPTPTAFRKKNPKTKKKKTPKQTKKQTNEQIPPKNINNGNKMQTNKQRPTNKHIKQNKTITPHHHPNLQPPTPLYTQWWYFTMKSFDK